MCSSTGKQNNNNNNNNSVLVDNAVTFYFVVFPCSAAPIFHSNRLPILHDTPPYTQGDVLYLGPAEEVAQQKLQELAFPLGFASKSSVAQHGPLWSSRVEFVRKMGNVQCVRLMMASTFVVSIASESVSMRTMQTKYAAVALVITCPPDKPYYRLLLDNFDSVMRQLLHISLDFAMSATQHFFFKLSRTLTAERLAAEMERHQSAVHTYHTLAAILVNAFTHKYSLPRIHGRTGVLNIDGEYGSSSSAVSNRSHIAKVSVDSLVYDALSGLCRFSDKFASSVVAGLLSLSNWENYGLISHQRRYGDQKNNQPHQQFDSDDIYSDYWKSMEAEEKSTLDSTEHRPSSDKSSSINDVAQKNNWSRGLESTAGASSFVSAVRHSRESSIVTGITSPTGTTTTCSLTLNRRGRVVIFCTDPILARRLLAIAAFFFRDSPIAARSTSYSSNPTPFAAKVESCAHSSVPVQWVAQEYDPRNVDELLCSPHTVENLVLIIAPRTMVCRRLRLIKTFSTNPILVERFRERFQPVRPFHFQVVDNEEILSDDTVRAALKEALVLQKKTGGAVSCVEFLESFMVWIVQLSCTSHRLHQIQDETLPFVSCNSPVTKDAVAVNFSFSSFCSFRSISSVLRSTSSGGGFFRSGRPSHLDNARVPGLLSNNVFAANCLSRASLPSVTDMDLGDVRVGTQLIRLLTDCCERDPSSSLRSGKGMCEWD
ncbi:hypothetical protein LSM04_005914 [Trypanosoma melophagium]|uniref:uncharacterized protein n=1 Tax=Trypanosoma melophagium TaxID=715481 RepID=UPI00351A90EB|nr:hypothetical protein LSM04_005914 [Trypanosoma melophagium]